MQSDILKEHKSINVNFFLFKRDSWEKIAKKL